MISFAVSGYKTKTEDLRPKNEDPFKTILKSLEIGSNTIIDWQLYKEQQHIAAIN